MLSGDDSFSRHIILNGLPKNVTPDKRDLFQRHITKKIAETLGHNRFSIQLLTDPQTLLVYGAFLSCATESEADAALAKLNMLHFTKTDVLSTYRWSALKNAEQGEETYVPPEMPTEESAEEDFVHNMADDEAARPQFVVKGGIALDCEWYWFDWEKNEPVLYRRPNIRKEDPLGKWSEMDRREKSLRQGLVSSLLPAVRPLPTWSSYGTMMISQHASGLKVWGGRSMHLLFEIPEEVEAFLVSPCEKYIVVKTANDLSVTNLRTAKKIRRLGNLDLHSDELWPITRFSADDTLVAVCKTGYNPHDLTNVSIGKMYIYTSETMKVLQGNDRTPAAHTFAIPGLYKAEWNPMVGTQMAHVSALGPNQGWKVVISNVLVSEEGIATEEVLMQRNFLQAEKLDLLWHPAGTHLSVKVSMRSSTEYFLFHVGPRAVSVMQLQIKTGYSAGRFSWQPNGDYFAMTLEKLNVKSGQLGETGVMQIYSIKSNKLKLLRETISAATHMFWSPRGARLVAANFNKSLLNFISINDSNVVVDQNKLSNISATDCQWDPTGRFYATWVSTLRNTTMAPHYRIFDYNGNELFRKESKPFSHLAWRPLPPSLLTDAEEKTVKESMKLILDEYEQTNAARREEERAKVERQKKEVEETFIKKMNDLARKMRDQHLAEVREEQEDASIWNRYWQSRLRALPEEDRITHEDVEEERVLSRRNIGTVGGKAE